MISQRLTHFQLHYTYIKVNYPLKNYYPHSSGHMTSEYWQVNLINQLTS